MRGYRIEVVGVEEPASFVFFGGDLSGRQRERQQEREMTEIELDQPVRTLWNSSRSGRKETKVEVNDERGTSKDGRTRRRRRGRAGRGKIHNVSDESDDGVRSTGVSTTNNNTREVREGPELRMRMYRLQKSKQDWGLDNWEDWEDWEAPEPWWVTGYDWYGMEAIK